MDANFTQLTNICEGVARRIRWLSDGFDHKARHSQSNHSGLKQAHIAAVPAAIIPFFDNIQITIKASPILRF
ncbi:hypothetical protein [Marinobacter sp. LV10R520-4]|uniref:hypothetical protein n=1 Tax=Marinobacter sp. LV10R520-4 TaxID=1761796 RepID=UPI00117DD4FA|nr:hypothetical protein [Marinobacter sp. LV10R520-4]